MTINLISDIHCRNNKFTPNFDFEKLTPADVLVIAGDIGTFVNRNKIIQKISDNYIGKDKQFKYLVYCWGNHDYYVTDHHWMKGHEYSYSGPLTSDNYVVIIDNIAFICSCMWSPIFNQFAISNYMNDYVYIREFTTKKCNELFEQNARWILNMINMYKGMGHKIVVVTHHLPSYQLIDFRYRSGSQSILNEAFAVIDAEWQQKFFDAKPDMWLHGHSHQFMDTTINDIRFVRNPFGYDWPSVHEYLVTDFKYNHILEIDNAQS